MILPTRRKKKRRGKEEEVEAGKVVELSGLKESRRPHGLLERPFGAVTQEVVIVSLRVIVCYQVGVRNGIFLYSNG